MNLIDAKEIFEAAERVFRNPKYHRERIETLLERWEKEDKEKL